MADGLDVVSHYRITDRLGGGGMGVIYSADDTRLKRTVALKFLAPDLTRDVEARDRFMQEAEAASALDHPNICTIYDVDTAADGRMFIAMAYYDGETLKARLARGPMPVADAVGVATQIARGLEKAHHAGIVHRDIKPANLMITRDGLVKILDFGVAKLRGRTSLTRTGVTLGTVAYMAPEQIRGGGADERADLWSLGAVLYEMLTGRSPFDADSDLGVMHNILHETPEPAARLRPDIPSEIATTIDRLMAKDPNQRYQTAAEVLQALTPRTAVATTQVRPRTSPASRVIVAAAVVALVAAAGTMAWVVKRGRDQRRVDTLVAEATRLADADDDIAALASVEAIERLAPKDPRLQPLEDRVAIRRTITTVPDGVDVYLKPYATPAAPWQHLGRTPLRDVRVARGAFRWKLEKDAFEPIEVAGPAARQFPALAARGTVPPSTVLVRGGPLTLNLTGSNYTLQFPAGDYLLDKFEVTNKQFKAFVDAGGYAKREYWAERFEKDGRTISWIEAMANLRDRTGRPGPSTWEVGRYPSGQDDFPVSGVSWYEADAFARFSRRSLPSVYHWVGAAGIGQAAYVTPLSNFGGKGPAPIGSFAGLSVSGAFDMAGNVREWCANAVAGTDERYILGGSWSDPPYALTHANALAPFDRSAENGLRLATYLDKVLPSVFTDPVVVSRRNFLAEHPVSDQLFAAYRAIYAYDPRPLDARVEARDDSNPDWIKERVSFRAAYGNERVPAYLFLPKGKQPPYEGIVYMPGAVAFQAGNSAAGLQNTAPFDYTVVSGRAVLYPIYQGTYERNTGQTSGWPQKTRAYEEWMVSVLNDARRGVDYLQSRTDIRSDDIAYLGTSWGAAVGTRIVALEPRFKTAVLLDGGFPQESQVLPELDALNYVTRITLPVLMINGDSDFIFPVESGQNPYFHLLGTPPEHKRHVVLKGGHYIIGQQRSQVVREVLDWLDRYLGPVDR